MPLKLMSDSAMRRKEEDEAKRKAVGGYKNGGMVKEYGGKESYSSKKAMQKHERAESPKKEKMEKMGKGYANGGMVKVKGKNC